MAANLLSHRINQLLLNARAPFPSEVRDAHELVRKWRYEQRLKLVRPDGSICDRDTDFAGVFTGVAAREEER